MAGAEHDEMTCRELVQVVTDYLEHALPDADRARLEAHQGELLSAFRGWRSATP